MNVFKTYSILFITIFILSFRTINASSSDEESENEDPRKKTIRKQKSCIKKITDVFKGDLHSHVLHAFTWLELNEEENCTYNYSQGNPKRYSGTSDIHAYYRLFENFLESDNIPDLHTFCNLFSRVLANPDQCFVRLNEYYSLNKDEVVRKAFYEYHYGNLPDIKLSITKHENTEETAKQHEYLSKNDMYKLISMIDNQMYFNISLAYFNKIKSKCILKVTAGIYTDYNEEINKCIFEINRVFKGDIYEHALKAINRFELNEDGENPENNYCTYVITQSDKRDFAGDVLAYYYSFEKYLLSGKLPTLYIFCARLQRIIESIGRCIDDLDLYYTYSKDEALRKAFYKYHYGNLPVIKFSIIKPTNTKEFLVLRNYVEQIEDQRYINLSLAYFDSIKSTFRLKLDSDNNDAEEITEDDRMLNPLEFCTRRYTTPKE